MKRPVLMQLLHPMAMLARELDPTRLILDESGGWAQGANMYLPYVSDPTKFNDVHSYPGQQISDEVYEKLLLTATKTHEEMRKMGLKPAFAKNVNFVSSSSAGNHYLVPSSSDMPPAIPKVTERTTGRQPRGVHTMAASRSVQPDSKLVVEAN